MASGIIGNDVPRKGLRVRVPCPPLLWAGFLETLWVYFETPVSYTHLRAHET